MATFQDSSFGFLAESVYGTGVTVSRFPEFTEETFDWKKKIVQGKGLRVAGRVARSARRVVPTAMGQGDMTMECTSKGMGTLWELCMGAAVSTNVSGATYQQNFTLGDTPKSATVQIGLPEVGGSVDAYTYTGCMVEQFEIDFANADIVMLKTSWGAKDLTTATAYATPSYVSTPNLFHFANGSVSSGTLTAATTTALASGTTTIADIRAGSIVVNHHLTEDRYNIGGGGRQKQPTVGLREITGKFDIEYDSTTFRDAVLNETPLCVILNWTAGALSAGSETLQIVLPEVKFDTQLAKPNGTDLIVQSMSFQVLDNLTAAQPLYISTRTADAAL